MVGDAVGAAAFGLSGHSISGRDRWLSSFRDGGASSPENGGASVGSGAVGTSLGWPKTVSGMPIIADIQSDASSIESIERRPQRRPQGMSVSVPAPTINLANGCFGDATLALRSGLAGKGSAETTAETSD